MLRIPVPIPEKCVKALVHEIEDLLIMCCRSVNCIAISFLGWSLLIQSLTSKSQIILT